jgi:hypothetical protein
MGAKLPLLIKENNVYISAESVKPVVKIFLNMHQHE